MEEILDAQRAGCPPEYFNIPIPTGHPLFDPDSRGHRELPFLRTRYDMRTGYSPHAPREQVGNSDYYHAYYHRRRLFIFLWAQVRGTAVVQKLRGGRAPSLDTKGVDSETPTASMG